MVVRCYDEIRGLEHEKADRRSSTLLQSFSVRPARIRADPGGTLREADSVPWLSYGLRRPATWWASGEWMSEFAFLDVRLE